MFRVLATTAIVQLAAASIATATSFTAEMAGTFWFDSNFDSPISVGDEILVTIKGGVATALVDATSLLLNPGSAAGVAGYNLSSMHFEIPAVGFSASALDAFVAFVDDIPDVVSTDPGPSDVVIAVGDFGFGQVTFQSVFDQGLFTGVGYDTTIAALIGGSPFDVAPNASSFAPIYVDVAADAGDLPIGRCLSDGPAATDCRLSWLGQSLSVAPHADTPAPVPLPAGLPLLAGGLALLGL
ncbi:MAG: hypothetical protein AAF566_02705, partial [Pseudomonadota bacterium]